MKTEIKWVMYDDANPGTYPANEDEGYLTTVEFRNGVRVWTKMYWMGSDERWGKGVTNVIAWSDVKPCMEGV